MKILVIEDEPPRPLCHGGCLHCYELCRRRAERHELLLVAARPCEESNWPFNFPCRGARAYRLCDDRHEFQLFGLSDIIERAVSCLGCYKNRFDDDCPDSNCMQEIGVDTGMQAIERQLHGPQLAVDMKARQR